MSYKFSYTETIFHLVDKGKLIIPGSYIHCRKSKHFWFV